MSGNNGHVLRVIVVEDDAQVSGGLLTVLVENGFGAVRITDVSAIDVEMVTQRAEVLVIDLPLPSPGLLETVSQVAESSTCGVIVLAFGWANSDITAVFDAGADDVIVGPPSARDIAARVRAVARRVRRSMTARRDIRPRDRPLPAVRPEATLTVFLNSAERCLVSPGGEETVLTEAETSVLKALLDARGRILSREQLGQLALHRAIEAKDRSIDQLILKLRRKLAEQHLPQETIISVRLRGYFIADYSRFGQMEKS